MDSTPIPSFEEEHSPACDLCGCIGNCACGHDPLSEKDLCGLDMVGVCPCCNINPNHMMDAIKADAEPIDLFDSEDS